MWLHKIIEWVQLREMNVSLYLSIYKYTYCCTYTYVYTYIQISISIYSHMYLNADGLCAGLYIICIYIYVYIHKSVGQVIHQSMYEILIQELFILNQCITHACHICREASIYAGSRAYMQASMRTCIYASSLYKVRLLVCHVCKHAYMPAGVHTCRQAYIYAGRHTYMQECMHICRQLT